MVQGIRGEGKGAFRKEGSVGSEGPSEGSEEEGPGCPSYSSLSSREQLHGSPRGWGAVD